MNFPGIYVINILDPDTKQVIIPSIDRIYAMSPAAAIAEFRRNYPWRSNWRVSAKLAMRDEVVDGSPG